MGSVPSLLHMRNAVIQRNVFSWEDDGTDGKVDPAGVQVVLDGKRLRKQPSRTFERTNRHNYTGDVLQTRPRITLTVCCGVCHEQTVQFLMVAGLSVGVIKHSGVFSCDWDSLEEEESVRHGARLLVRWSSARGQGECGRRRRPLHRATITPSLPFLFRPPSFSSILASHHPSVSQRGFVSCDSPKPIIGPTTSLHPTSRALDDNNNINNTAATAAATPSKPHQGRQLD